MTCDELLGFLHDYVGGELVVECRETFEVHVAGCERCGVIVHSYTHTVRVARALPRCGALPPGVEARLRALIEPELNRGKPA
jgi:anti-sigma factor RsiW